VLLIAGDGVIDEEEFEFTLHDGFDVSPKDCQVAYRMMTKVRRAYCNLF